MPDLSRCNLCGAVLRVVHYPGWGNEPVKHECRPTQHPLETHAEGNRQRHWLRHYRQRYMEGMPS